MRIFVRVTMRECEYNTRVFTVLLLGGHVDMHQHHVVMHCMQLVSPIIIVLAIMCHAVHYGNSRYLVVASHFHLASQPSWV